MHRSLTFALALTCTAVAVDVVAAPTPVAEPVKKKAARPKTGIEWKVTPSGVELHVDGKKVGTSGSVEWTKVKPGVRAIRLVHHGDEVEFDVSVPKGQVIQLKYTFGDE